MKFLKSVRKLVASPFVVAQIFGACFVCVPALGQSTSSLEASVLDGDAPADSSASERPSNDTADNAPALAAEIPDEVQELERAIQGPSTVPMEHVFAVQRRFIEKADRVEVVPFVVGLQPADSFRLQTQWGLGAAYHFSESFGLEFLHVAMISNFSSNLDEGVQSAANRSVDRKEPAYSIGSSLLWTPLKSKAATREQIFHFEGYLLLGGGTTRVDDTFEALVMSGLGFRAFVSKRTALRFELRNYTDFGDSTVHRFTALLGASVFLGGAARGN